MDQEYGRLDNWVDARPELYEICKKKEWSNLDEALSDPRYGELVDEALGK